jgi:succinyl-diaminopimelate desuccinylase
MMMGMLGELSGITGSQRDFIRFFNSRIGFNLTGSNLCGDIRDEVSGPMVFNAGVLEWKGSNIHLKLNIRYPVTIKGEEIIRRLDDSVKNCGYTTKLVLDSAPLYVSCDDPLVTALMDIYHHYRDDKTKPLLIGGGTFARSIPHAVAFGPMFPEEEDLAHCANENISLDNLVLNAKIYAQAIYALAK